MDIVKQFSIQCFVTIILTFCLIEQTNSCFIRNCPPGGKRSMDTLTRVSRQFSLLTKVILNNSKFGDYLERIYPIELEINDTTDTVKSASYLDLHLEFNNEGRLKTKLYDKRDDFSFPIVNFPFLSSNIPAAPAYGCMSCGPELSGQCVGPDICCGPFGCYMGTLESSICQKENESTHPCEIQGAPCGSRGQGNCVTDGICCDSGACSYNAKCKTNNMKDNQAILNVLNELLQSRDLTDK